MEPNKSFSISSPSKEQSTLNCEHGTPSTNSTPPVSKLTQTASIEPKHNLKTNSLPIVGSTSAQTYSMSPSESSTVISTTENSQASELKPIPENKEANSKPSLWQYTPDILKFLGQQMKSQLPLLFGGVIGLVIVAILISQTSGGVKLKLDLDVAPASNQSEKIPITLIGQASGGIKLKLDLEVSPASNQSEKTPITK
ncbi:hypothetical protein NIES4074_39110 [Cylindrospermum sp. NIES-4074]|nr:hypothetical protein NIES4074_39110 [Cylindrospermum sp. NIES-4074]